MNRYIPERIFVERSIAESEITRTVLSRAPGVPVEYIDSSESKLEESRTWTPSIARAKRSLVLAEFKGQFFKACPGQQSRGDSRNVCCDYYVVNFASNCHMECSYCYLQTYLNFPYMVVYANVKKLLGELREAFEGTPAQFFRVGTGELADSLALDPLTAYSRPLVEFFAGYSNAVLELKTKSDCIEELGDLDHRRRTVVSWSVNPPYIQKMEEHKTASTERRLEAARKCVEWGYPVAFHFDPLVDYGEWRSDYRQLVKDVFARVSPQDVAWISLGALRMSREQRELMKERFPTSILPLGELVAARDGKLRYFKPIRTEMYRELLSLIEEYGKGAPVYACMERPEVWRRTFGEASPQDRDLGEALVQGIEL